VPQHLDPRIVRVGIEVDGRLKVYEGSINVPFNITASGTKYANANQNECEVKITNLDKETRNFILTETSPFNLNKTQKILYLDAGRQSYGTVRVFYGNIVTSTPSQPPDIDLTLKCLTGNFQKGNIVSVNSPASAKISAIAQQIAENLNVTLDFQASDKNIANYTFTGAALKQVDKMNSTGIISAYIDNNTLVVKDLNLPLANRRTIVNLDTGMIGVPEVTEQGIKVTFLLDGQTTLGGQMDITSQIYPAANGAYVIYKLGFNISSRDVPFYWIAEGKRI